ARPVPLPAAPAAPTRARIRAVCRGGACAGRGGAAADCAARCAVARPPGRPVAWKRPRRRTRVILATVGASRLSSRTAPSAPGRAALVLLMACAGACAGQGIHDDGTSVSFGPPNRGALVNPLVLPPSGDGYWMPPTWARRGLHYGTGELVGMIAHLGRDLAQRGAGRPLAVADLSPQRGGPSRWHRSHQTGRDVDLIYFARDAEGRPVPADSMRHFRADGA